MTDSFVSLRAAFSRKKDLKRTKLWQANVINICYVRSLVRIDNELRGEIRG